MSTGNKQKRVLLVMSSVDEMGTSGKHTGTWFTELAAPYYILTEAGYEVVLASPKGGEAPIDWPFGACHRVGGRPHTSRASRLAPGREVVYQRSRFANLSECGGRV